MKIINIKDKLGNVISPNNIKSEEELDSWLQHCKDNKVFGKNERWVRAKYDVYIDDSIDLPPVTETIYPEEEYLDEDVLDTETRETMGEYIEYVKLRADYLIEVLEYIKVPYKVTPRQIRLALNQLGIRQMVEDLIEQVGQDAKDVWEYSTEIQRNFPLILQLQSAINYTDDQIDEIFILAETK